MIPVKSDSIARVGYEPTSKTLKVQFKNGGIYHYSGVSSDQHAALMRAESIGSHFYANIRPKFKAIKV